MGSLDGRIIVGFQEDVPIPNIEHFLSTFASTHAEKFIDTTRIEHVRPLLDFLPEQYWKPMQYCDGYQPRYLQSLAGMILEHQGIERVIDTVGMSERILQRGGNMPEHTGGVLKTKKGKRVYAIRGLLKNYTTPPKRGPEKE